VIGFGIVSILLALAYRSWTIDGNDEVEDDIHDRRLASLPDERSMDDVDEEIEPSEFAEDVDPAGAGSGSDGRATS
jgi:multicomponent Na+:H+ antiporter subunit C